jgi:hypothetical protein
MAANGFRCRFVVSAIVSACDLNTATPHANELRSMASRPYLMDARNPQWKDDPGMKAFDEFLARDFPEGNPADSMVMTGFNVPQILVQVLKQCGDSLTRANVMR